ncbi:MAG: hypothetical protein IJ695_07045 [Butyrivibrio sp.]|nr:hypothetical protein [Butyrivibrio sp.]
MIITVSLGTILVAVGAFFVLASLVLQVTLHLYFKKQEEKLIKELEKL